MAYSNWYGNLALWSYLVQGYSGPQCAIDVLPIAPRRHDWPSEGSGPRGQECCDCVLMTQPPGPTAGAVAIHYESFAPQFGGVGTEGGNGGDLLCVTSDGWIKAFATEDGGRPGQLYYFVGPGFGMAGAGPGGWVISAPDITPGAWKSVVTQIVQSYPGPYKPMGLPSPAYTRYRVEVLDVPRLTAGGNPDTFQSWCLISEHYDTSDPSTANEMERFVFGKYWGKLRWEKWQRGGQTSQGAIDRAPAMSFCYPASGDAAGVMALTDARTYTNFWSDEYFRVWPDASWPGEVTLP